MGHRRPRTSWTAIFAVAVCFICHALAATADASLPVETLIIDNRSPYRSENGGWVMLSPADAENYKLRLLRKRQQEASTTPKPSVTTTLALVVGKPTTTSTSVEPPSALPSVLDSLVSDFTAGSNGDVTNCPKFINSFRNSQQFKDCYPLSLLLENSISFFQTQKSLVALTRTLEATCNANVTSCSIYFGQLAQNFTAPENCGADFQRGQAAVVAAHRGMIAYAPIYQAGCLRDDQSSAYCYATAINRPDINDTHKYFLALNKTMPGSTRPSCDYCTKQTMALFQVATGDRRQSLVNTYPAAAKQVNLVCGPGFVNETLAAEVIPGNAGVRGVSFSMAMLSTSISVVIAFMFLT
ncbi:hypothetical protein QBC38DRAFT_510965 [Podospora fimiseda]|uniref:DUF7729 domain-containing protein n=1 Tax=Podospora fimiseda TaxID=252190 RepID=A0AAN7BLB6_9PEZI|nr:hypothetical protein QBC38DRAFT_510965 [Podospora fimiseda]